MYWLLRVLNLDSGTFDFVSNMLMIITTNKKALVNLSSCQVKTNIYLGTRLAYILIKTNLNLTVRDNKLNLSDSCFHTKPYIQLYTQHIKTD